MWSPSESKRRSDDRLRVVALPGIAESLRDV